MKEEKEKKKRKMPKALKASLITLGSLVGVIGLTAGSYVVYVAAQYYRIEDNQVIEVKNQQNNKVEVNKDLTLTTLNAGFGAYSHDFDFFMDWCVEPDGSTHYGTHAKAFNKDEAILNTTGCFDLLNSFDSDFYTLQEVDTDSDRSHHVNQKEMFADGFKNYAESFACNFHTAYFFYPIQEFIGASNSGIQTFSRYNIESSIRKSFTVDDSFPVKLFDLDRCFNANYIPTNNGKYLVLINVHMSAYDEGGIIRNQQIKELNSFMLSETEKGNYVIASGDYNHDLLVNNPAYNYTKENYPYKNECSQITQPWVSYMFEEDGSTRFDKTFKIACDDSVPTCRSVDKPFKLGYTFSYTVDGFIYSENIEVKKVIATNLSCDESERFAYSDHQPVTMTFSLK